MLILNVGDTIMVRDSDPSKWIYWEHTKAKHQLLDKYLGGWLAILGTRHDRLLIFDGFAGRGEYPDGSSGSPLIILQKANELMQQARVEKVICAFVEKDHNNFTNLSTVLERVHPQFPNVGVIGPYNSDFASVVDDVIEQTKGRLIPSFFFIDPFGFTGVPFRIVERIFALQRSEVFITLMLRDIGRFLSNPNLEDTFDSLFGTTDWRHIISTGATNEDKEHLLRDLYVEQLTKLGCYVTPFRVCMDEKAQTLYYMVHATKHPKGRILMKEVMARQGAGGLFAYLGPADSRTRAQLRLLAEDIPALKNLLLKEFAGRTISYDKVQEESCMDTNLVDKDYREALKGLRNDGHIQVKPVTSKTERGLRGRDLVTFPS